MTHYKSLLLALLFAFAMIFGGMGTAAADLGGDADDQTLAYEDDDWNDEGDDWDDEGDDWDDEGDDWDDEGDDWDEGDDDW